MSTYENAPATKLLATACACCGKKIVDSVSIETGLGPDCRAKYGVDAVVGEAARAEANKLVHAVAKKGVTHAECVAACEQLRALGFVVLADRILWRFRLTFEKLAERSAASEGELARLRAEYAKVRAEFAYAVDPAAFNLLVKAEVGEGASPADYVAVAKALEIRCSACGGSGAYHGHHDDGDCYRCSGKGHQTLEDVRRNRVYDARNGKGRRGLAA